MVIMGAGRFLLRQCPRADVVSSLPSLLSPMVLATKLGNAIYSSAES